MHERRRHEHDVARHTSHPQRRLVVEPPCLMIVGVRHDEQPAQRVLVRFEAVVLKSDRCGRRRRLVDLDGCVGQRQL